MFVDIIQPRFSETDALGHINNTVFAVWFEGARTALFRIFTPELNLQQWPLIIARVTIDYHAQTQYGQPVEIRTFISRLGGSSFDVYQQAWQNGVKCATGTTVMVQFDYQSQTATPLSSDIRAALQLHALG
ncbi:thioesterase [Arsukibacterium ikkense]|uniref:Thioesterase n=1 Tax=Arsukibacterium ikkense TaxID=336831 RepID=A0A0M2UZU1_9GAMM|nr:thioesterase family protein [Arsukibacterium ikkense]KKO43876.1 thioesterase [Arsukibacterium ikkense]